MAKIYLIAGEISGDFIGNRLIRSLKDIYKLEEIQLEFVGVGGSQMEEAGLECSLFPMSQINLMDFVEIIPHISRITKLIKQTIDDIIQHNPDLLITIDSPGFTYRVVKKVREARPNLKIVRLFVSFTAIRTAIFPKSCARLSIYWSPNIRAVFL